MGTEIKDLAVVGGILATDYLLISRPGVTPNPIALVSGLPVGAAEQAGLDKLAGIEAGATADQTGAEIKVAYELEADSNAFSDSLKAKLEAIDAAHYGNPVQDTTALMAIAEADITDKERRFVEDDTSDYFYDSTAVSGDVAPSDQTGGTGWWRQGVVGGESAASLKIKYESNPDTNAYDDAAQSKLAGIEASATADQSDSEIASGYANIVAKVSAGEITSGTESTVRRFSPADIVSLIATHETAGGGDLSAEDINTLAELNAIVADATLIDTGDARLSDARTPTAHTHPAADISDASANGRSLVTAADYAAMRTLLGLAIGTNVQAYSAVLAATTASFLTADETKLDGIASGATANDSNANLLARANHTGTQAISTVTSLQTTLDAKLVAADINTLAELNAIVADATLIDTGDARLSDARTPTAHTHPAADISDASANGRSLVTAADYAAMRTLLNVTDGADITDASSVAAAGAPIISSGSGAPASTPSAAGDVYIDTTGDIVWAAAGTASSADWKQATGMGGGDLLAANNLSDVTNAGTARTNLGLAIGTNVQAYSAVLAATTASFLTADETKLDGIASGATANDSNANLLARANHTGTQAISTVTSLQTTLDAKLVAADINTLAELNAIVADATLIDTGDARLSDARTPTAHTHPAADISDASANGRSLVTAADYAAMRTLLNVTDGADVTDASSVAAAGAPIISSGSGAPASTPSAAGDVYIDTTGDIVWAAAGTASSADWKQATGMGGGDLLAANNLSDVTNAGTARTNLGLAIGTNVQAYSAVLAATTASFLTADETKLDGIASGATANDSNANLLARANHTGTQAISTVTSLQTTLDAKLVAADINTLAELNAIVADATLIDTGDARLSDARTPTAHTHPAADISDASANGRSLVTAADYAAMRTLLNVTDGADVTDASSVAAAGAPIISSGSGAPASTPSAAGDVYIDTTGDIVWAAAGTASSADWKQATGMGGGDLLAANNLSDVTNAGTARTNLGLAIGTNVQAYSAVLAATTASFLTADETKLDGIASGATANDSNANLLARANHTGTQAISTVTSLQTTLDAKLVAADINTLAELNAIVADATLIDTGDARLSDARTPTAHTHPAADISDASANGRSLVTAADYAAMRTLLNVTDGADVTDASSVAAAGAPIISSGSGAPASTPSAAGDVYIDTTGDIVWAAAGTASSADWKQATGMGGGDLLAANNLSDVTNAGTARTNLGLAIGTDVQAFGALMLTGGAMTGDLDMTSAEIIGTTVDLHSSSDVNVTLGDQTGTDEFRIKNNIDQEVASIDSQGNLEVTGQILLSYGTPTLTWRDSLGGFNEKVWKIKYGSTSLDLTPYQDNESTAGKGALSAKRTDENCTQVLLLDGLVDIIDGTGVDINLQDAAGAHKLFIKDSGDVEVAAIDSDGNITTSGTVDGRDVATDGTKLDGIASGATANDSNANLLARANHTGTQAISTVTSLQTTLDAKLVAADINTLAELNAIVADATLIDTGDARLSDARTPTAHTHPAADISDASANGRSLVTAADYAAMRTLLNVTDGADVTDASSVAAAGAPIISSGAGAPASTPSAAGDVYIDTTGDIVWAAAGTASSADWKQATGAGGGDLLAANNLSDVANAGTARTNLGLAIGSDVQAYSAVLAATTASFLTADETKLDAIEAGADITDTANVMSAGALMDSEVDADIKTLVLPASTTISTFGATLVDDADAATARSTIGVGDASLTAKGIAEAATQAETDTGTDTLRYVSPDTLNGWDGKGMVCELERAVSDEATALTTGTAKITFRMPYAMTLTAVRASVGTAPTGATIIIDVNEGGTTVLSTKLTIDATEKTSVSAAVAAVISDSVLADDAEITIDIDQVGSTVAGAGLKVVFIGTRA